MLSQTPIRHKSEMGQTCRFCRVWVISDLHPIPDMGEGREVFAISKQAHLRGQEKPPADFPPGALC